MTFGQEHIAYNHKGVLGASLNSLKNAGVPSADGVLTAKTPLAQKVLERFALDSVRGPYPSNMSSIRSEMRAKSSEARSSKESNADEARPRRRSLVDS